MTITLQAIKAEHAKVADMIAAFEAQSKVETLFFPEVSIDLQPGEHYAGIITGKDGEPSHHLVLLPGQVEDANWNKAMEWAGQQGGEYVASLPTRREQALLFSNLKEEFEGSYYWSCEAHASDASYAWYQHFYNGCQGTGLKLDELRGRAVRRLIIE